MSHKYKPCLHDKQLSKWRMSSKDLFWRHLCMIRTFHFKCSFPHNCAAELHLLAVYVGWGRDLRVYPISHNLDTCVAFIKCTSSYHFRWRRLFIMRWPSDPSSPDFQEFASNSKQPSESWRPGHQSLNPIHPGPQSLNPTSLYPESLNPWIPESWCPGYLWYSKNTDPQENNVCTVPIKTSQ